MTGAGKAAKRWRETAQERDERIVAEAGPWMTSSKLRSIVSGRSPATMRDTDWPDWQPAYEAAARILNRIAKKRGKP